MTKTACIPLPLSMSATIGLRGLLTVEATEVVIHPSGAGVSARVGDARMFYPMHTVTYLKYHVSSKSEPKAENVVDPKQAPKEVV